MLTDTHRQNILDRLSTIRAELELTQSKAKSDTEYVNHGNALDFLGDAMSAIQSI